MRDKIDFSGKWTEIESVDHFEYIVEASGAREPPSGWSKCKDDVHGDLKNKQCFIEFGEDFKTNSDRWWWLNYTPDCGEEIKIDMEEDTAKPKQDPKKHSHYFKDVSSYDTIDIYRVLSLFNVTDPCLQHAAKKVLLSGERGVKGEAKDIQEAIDSLNRKLDMMEEDSQ